MSGDEVKRYTIPPEWTTPELCKDCGDGAVVVVLASAFNAERAARVAAEKTRDTYAAEIELDIAEFKRRDQVLEEAANTVTRLTAERDRLAGSLAACGVIAGCDDAESFNRLALTPYSPYWTDSLASVTWLRAAATELRTQRDRLAAEVAQLTTQVATEYVRGREHEQAARDTVHVPHIERLRADVGRYSATIDRLQNERDRLRDDLQAAQCAEKMTSDDRVQLKADLSNARAAIERLNRRLDEAESTRSGEAFAGALADEMHKDEVARLRKDAGRLDWILRNCDEQDDGWYLPFVYRWVGPVPREDALSLHAALDAAIATQGGGT